MPLPRFERDPDAGVVAGVCSGIARALGVDPTLVRLVFALLALAGGAGILLYLALWAYVGHRSAWVFGALGILGIAGVLGSLGLSNRVVLGIALVVGGLVLVWRRGGGLRASDPTGSIAGTTLAAAGAVLVLSNGGIHAAALTPGAIGGSLLLVGGPWLLRLALERDAERAARIRTEERADLAARVHDSVLQTLALIQRHAREPRRVASLARRQERELRGWLYADRPLGDDGSSLVAALSAAAAEVEELHGVRVELASSGDAAAAEPLVLAAREAMANAAKFAGVGEIDIYVEVGDDEVVVFVRDRGAGFDSMAVPPERRGIAESIEGRLERAGGTASVTSEPGSGTEVEL